MSKKRLLAVLVLVPLLGALGIGIYHWTSGGSRPTIVSDVELATHRPAEVLVDDYVGSAACRSCHERNFSTWSSSYHHTMTQLPSPQSVLGNFDDVHLDYDGRHYHLQRRGDQYWAVMHDPDQPLDREHPDATRIERPITLVTGSHHMQLYWYATGQSRVLGLLPVHYLMEEKKWLPARATLLRPTDDQFSSETGRWNQRCIQCHTTHGRSRPLSGGSGMDSEVAEFGISCEACHGPGAKHVEFRRQKLTSQTPPQKPAADPIVNPATLSSKSGSQVCGLCHSYTFAKSTTSELQEMSQGFFYRPGQQLSDSLVLVRRDDATRNHLKRFQVDPDVHFEERFWSDGMVRVAGREYNGMVESPCYLRGEMSCLSCHVMHKPQDDPRELTQWANRQVKHEMDSDHACLQCHSVEKFATAAHTHHEEASSGSRCYNCHLPHTTYGILRAMRSHQIESPNATVTKKTGRPNGCNLCHLDKTLEWTADHLSQWYGQAKPTLTDDERATAASIRWALSGDAGQRAIAGWNMGWEPALAASGQDWLPPILAQLLRDDYDVVRMIAFRSLRKLNGYENIDFDFVGPARQREAVAKTVREQWDAAHTSRSGNRPELLLDEQGQLLRERFQRLNFQKNRRPVVLLE